MRLAAAQITNFRSIVDSGHVPIDDRVTVLIGKNEQGKTTFLRGVASFNEKYVYTPRDLPSHLRPTLEGRNKAEIPIVSIYLVPDAVERAELAKTLVGMDAAIQIRITRYFDGHYQFESVDTHGNSAPLEVAAPDVGTDIQTMKTVASQLKDRLQSHIQRHPAFEPSFPLAVAPIDHFLDAKFSELDKLDDLIKTLATSLQGVPNQDQPIQEDVASALKEIQRMHSQIQARVSEDRRSYLRSRIPKFVFHSTSTDQIPNNVSLEPFLKEPEATSKGMANLCRAAGLSIQKVQELSTATDAATREPYEDYYKAHISGAINEYWTQQTYTIFFRIERDVLSVSVQDKTYSQRIPPSERSDGFRWYLSFYCALLNEVSENVPTVLLLDNPGLELHPDGQRDIKRSIERKHSAAMQVIYVTHSPAMIDPYSLEQVRRVDLYENAVGTKVMELGINAHRDSDLLEPVRSAIGASLITTLMANKFNIVAEGAADRPLLEGAIAAYAPDRKHEILVTGSVAETREMLPTFFERGGLPYVIYLDSDSAGRELENKLTRAGVPQAKVCSLRSLIGDELCRGTDIELEDLVSDAIYSRAVLQTYPGKSAEVPPTAAGKRSKRYEEVFKATYNIGFAKRRVAELLKENLISGDVDEATSANLRAVIEKMVATLMAQKDRPDHP